jgi:2-polyprenyl-3-methyl-5-hydroxy-6-metoxy-1,4-benzoquinol methylase
MPDPSYLTEARTTWDSEAPTFDLEPDHGMRDPECKSAWKTKLTSWLPARSSQVLEVGCGTGSMSMLAAELGHEVTGNDCSPKMIDLAREKATASGLQIAFDVMDAARPSMQSKLYDVVMCRHLLWALPDPELVLERWRGLLTESGRLVLIEGFWMTGAGLKAQGVIEMMSGKFSKIVHESLNDQSVLWGKQVTDERYAVVATR